MTDVAQGLRRASLICTLAAVVLALASGSAGAKPTDTSIPPAPSSFGQPTSLPPVVPPPADSPPTTEVSQVKRATTLVPATSTLESGVMSTMSTTTRYAISTSSNWVTLRGEPASFAIALGRNGWGVDVDRVYNSWRFGYVKGGTNTGGTYAGSTVEKCLWILAEQLSPAGTPQNNCDGQSSIPESAYMIGFNGNRVGVITTGS